MRAEHIDERQVRRHALDVVGATDEDAPTRCTSTIGNLGQESGLSNSRLSTDKDNATLAKFRRGHALQQRTQFALAPHEGRGRWPKQGRGFQHQSADSIVHAVRSVSAT